MILLRKVSTTLVTNNTHFAVFANLGIWSIYLFFNAGEVEEHIDRLEKLVPDWISREIAPSGDIMYK